MTAYDAIREKYDAVLALNTKITEEDRHNNDAASKQALFAAVDALLVCSFENFLPDYDDPAILNLTASAGQPTMPVIEENSLEDLVPAMVPVRLMRVLISVHKIPVYITKMQQFGNFSAVYSPLIFGPSTTDASGAIIDKIAQAKEVIARLKTGDFSPFVEDEEDDG